LPTYLQTGRGIDTAAPIFSGKETWFDAGNTFWGHAFAAFAARFAALSR
jgi:hypothetical protein